MAKPVHRQDRAELESRRVHGAEAVDRLVAGHTDGVVAGTADPYRFARRRNDVAAPVRRRGPVAAAVIGPDVHRHEGDAGRHGDGVETRRDGLHCIARGRVGGCQHAMGIDRACIRREGAGARPVGRIERAGMSITIPGRQRQHRGFLRAGETHQRSQRRMDWIGPARRQREFGQRQLIGQAVEREVPDEVLEIGVAVGHLDAADIVGDGDADHRGAVGAEDSGKGAVRETRIGIAEHDGVAGFGRRSAVRDDRHRAGRRGGGFRHIQPVVPVAEMEVEFLDGVELDQDRAADGVDEQKRGEAAVVKVVDDRIVLGRRPYREFVGVGVVGVADRQRQVRRIGRRRDAAVVSRVVDDALVGAVDGDDDGLGRAFEMGILDDHIVGQGQGLARGHEVEVVVGDTKTPGDRPGSAGRAVGLQRCREAMRQRVQCLLRQCGRTCSGPDGAAAVFVVPRQHRHGVWVAAIDVREAERTGSAVRDGGGICDRGRARLRDNRR